MLACVVKKLVRNEKLCWRSHKYIQKRLCRFSSGLIIAQFLHFTFGFLLETSIFARKFEVVFACIYQILGSHPVFGKCIYKQREIKKTASPIHNFNLQEWCEAGLQIGEAKLVVQVYIYIYNKYRPAQLQQHI